MVLRSRLSDEDRGADTQITKGSPSGCREMWEGGVGEASCRAEAWLEGEKRRLCRGRYGGKEAPVQLGYRCEREPRRGTSGGKDTGESPEREVF